MIFNIRGTSGSGKSHLVRRLFQLGLSQPEFVEGRKQPMYYTLQLITEDRRVLADVAIIGHYETACGGCDTIKLMDDVDRYVRELYSKGYHVIFEGVIFSTEYPRTARMVQDGLPIEIINLTTPIEECLNGVNSRRQAKKPGAEAVNPKNTTNRVRNIERCNDRLVEAGALIFDMDREKAYRYIVHKLTEEPK